MSIHWPIIRTLLKNLRRTVIVDDRRSYKAIELLVGAMHLAGHIAGRSQTQTLGLLLPTSGAFPMAALAGWMLGKTIVPINYLLKPEEMNYIIRDCGCDTVITVQPMLDFLGSHADECLYAPQGGGGGPPTAVKHLVRFEDVSFSGVPEIFWPKLAGDDDLAILLYTSGTSGKPKGVMLSHGNITANMRQINDYVHFDPASDVMFGVLPQFHTFGLTVLTMLPLTFGLKAVYTARFVPHRIIQSIKEHRATVFVAIPSMYNAMLHVKHGGPEDLASLRYVVSGGEPLPQAVFDGFKDKFGITINEGYGLTETSPVTNWCRPHEWRRGSVGKALPEVDQVIVDIDTGRVLPPNTDGEIRMRGPNVMHGYYKLPEETAKAFDARGRWGVEGKGGTGEPGYFRTGDIGRLDDDGFLYITGRLKEMLIIGGENVFPREIEEVLNQHPAIKDSGVVGKKDPVRGELPVAFVELKEEESGFGSRGSGLGSNTKDTDASSSASHPNPEPRAPSPDLLRDIMKFLRAKLAGYKIPDEIRVVDALPRNPTGKVMRRELKKMVAETVF